MMKRKKSLKSNTLSRFGLEIKRNKNKTKKNLKDINSMELTEFAERDGEFDHPYRRI